MSALSRKRNCLGIPEGYSHIRDGSHHKCNSFRGPDYLLEMPPADALFERLYVQHAPAVRRLVRFLGADADLADDIVAETFARAWAASSPIRHGTVRAYLFTIARNLQRRAAKLGRSHDQLSDDLVDYAITVQQSVEARSDLKLVLHSMRLLQPDDRAALLMRAAEQMSYEDIARALGLTASNAKVRVHRARIKLAASLEAHESKPSQ